MPVPDGLAATPENLAQARACQEELARRVETIDRLTPPAWVAGADVHYPRDDHEARAAVVLLTFPGLELVETATARLPSPFPYRSGYLSFREAPAVLAALAGLSRPPDLLFLDGQGLAHPRGLGLACHVGVQSGLPTIGVAKSRLVGDYQEPGPHRGDQSPLTYRGVVVGAVLRTRDRVRPLFVSPGHRVSLATALAYTLACHEGFREPRPLRLAHQAASRLCGRGRGAEEKNRR
ncbi:MAG: deoxyribonuclease V [Deltaproteobacteria bacterium]|nr:deoxyribonuclease V [Deltaproteobacteria bacterium]